MIMVSLPCGFETSTHPEAWFSHKGITIYARGETLPEAICAAGLIFWRKMKSGLLVVGDSGISLKDYRLQALVKKCPDAFRNQYQAIVKMNSDEENIE